jgi:hypothetical protein
LTLGLQYTRNPRVDGHVSAHGMPGCPGPIDPAIVSPMGRGFACPLAIARRARNALPTANVGLLRAVDEHASLRLRPSLHGVRGPGHRHCAAYDPRHPAAHASCHCPCYGRRRDGRNGHRLSRIHGRRAQVFYDGMRHRPETTFGTVNADVLADKDPSPENFCRVIRASAWSG